MGNEHAEVMLWSKMDRCQVMKEQKSTVQALGAFCLQREGRVRDSEKMEHNHIDSCTVP